VIDVQNSLVDDTSSMFVQTLRSTLFIYLEKQKD